MAATHAGPAPTATRCCGWYRRCPCPAEPGCLLELAVDLHQRGREGRARLSGMKRAMKGEGQDPDPCRRAPPREPDPGPEISHAPPPGPGIATGKVEMISTAAPAPATLGAVDGVADGEGEHAGPAIAVMTPTSRVLTIESMVKRVFREPDARKCCIPY